MADELLPPEEEQQTTPEPSKTRFRDTARNLGNLPAAVNRDTRAGLRDALPQASEILDNTRSRERGLDPQPFKEAFDKNGDLASTGEKLGQAALGAPKRSAQAAANNWKKVGFAAKNKKWFIAGGTGLGLLIPIFMFFFWLMLFKNVHIKNLYVTYRWAQFNRGLNQALKGELEYAKSNPDVAPEGAATDAVSADAPVDEIIKKTNSDFNPDNIDPADATKVEAEANRVSAVEQSIEGTSEKALSDAGVSRNVKAAEGEGATVEEKAKSAEEKAKANVEEDISSKGIDKSTPDVLKEGVDETKAQEKAGKPASEAIDSGVEKVITGDGWRGAFSKASTIVFGTTMYCIFRDLYTSARDQLVKLAVNGSVGISQELNKTADCQKLGKCDATQIGAVADRYDNNDESFMDTCGAARVQQTSNPNCKEIDPKFVVNGLAKEVGGAGGFTLNSVDDLLDPPIKLGPFGIQNACSVVMSPYFQGIVTIAEGAAIVTTGGGWAALGKGVTAGALTFAGTAGGKALIASYIGKLSGSVYKNLSPHDMGNLTDMGNLATSSASCNKGCVQASDSELGELDRQYRAERIAANSKRSVLEKFFDNESPDSVLSRVALNTPATPSAMIGRMQRFVASIINPTKLLAATGNGALALTRNDTAYAATDNGASVYGLSGKVKIPPNLMPGASSYADVVKWGESANLSSYSQYDKCDTDSYASQVGSSDTTCAWDSMGTEARMYMQYTYLQNAAFKNALVRNNQDTATGAAAIAGATAASGDTSGAQPGVNTKGKPCPAGTSDKGSASTKSGTQIELCDVGGGTVVNQSAAQAFYNMIQAAAKDGVQLYGGGFRSYQSQIALRIQHGCGGALLYDRGCKGHPPTAVPGRSNHEEGLAVDFKNSSSHGTAVYRWLAANASKYGIYNLPSEAWHWSTTGH